MPVDLLALKSGGRVSVPKTAREQFGRSDMNDIKAVCAMGTFPAIGFLGSTHPSDLAQWEISQ